MNQRILIRRMEPPTSSDPLQPLREVGCTDKTRFWDIEEILGALREANSRGIRPESLFATAEGAKETLSR